MCDPITALTGTALGSANQAREARKDARMASQAQARIQERRMQREKIRALRESRIANAQLDIQSAVSGTQNTSAVQGASSNIQQQYATNTAFVEQIQGLQRQVQTYQQASAKHSSNAQDLNAITNLALQGANFVG